MKFNVKVKFTDSDNYIGQPLVLQTAQGSKLIFTVIDKYKPFLPKGTVSAMYLVSLSFNGMYKKIEDLSIINRYVPTTFSLGAYGYTVVLRTPTIEEYRMYKKILREQVIYDKWI